MDNYNVSLIYIDFLFLQHTALDPICYFNLDTYPSI